MAPEHHLHPGQETEKDAIHPAAMQARDGRERRAALEQRLAEAGVHPLPALRLHREPGDAQESDAGNHVQGDQGLQRQSVRR